MSCYSRENFGNKRKLCINRDVLKDEVGVDKIKSSITRQLSGLKVACHPGCHYMRPIEWMESDDPMRPTNLKKFYN